jgi:hypothetical protein
VTAIFMNHAVVNDNHGVSKEVSVAAPEAEYIALSDFAILPVGFPHSPCYA